MAEPGQFVVTQDSPVGTYGYTEPEPVCWGNKAATAGVTEEEFNSIVAEQRLVTQLFVDVNGDQIQDKFFVAETPDKFVVLLYRGAIRQGVWENCGGGSYHEIGFEQKPQVLGTISKDAVAEVKKLFLELSVNANKAGSPPTLRLKNETELTAAHTRREEQQVLWESSLAPCSKPPQGILRTSAGDYYPKGRYATDP